MGGLGTWEIALIFLAILLIFGAKRIPEIARGLGKGIRELKDATNDIKQELTVAPPPPQITPPAAPPTAHTPPVAQPTVHAAPAAMPAPAPVPVAPPAAAPPAETPAPPPAAPPEG